MMQYFGAWIPKRISNNTIIQVYEIFRKFYIFFHRRSKSSIEQIEQELCKHSDFCLNQRKYIEDQNAWSDIRYGKYSMQYSGCEAFATFNAMVSLLGDKADSLAKVIASFEQDGIVLSGKFGTSPKAMSDYLIKQGFSTVMTTKHAKFDSIGEISDSLILTMYNDKHDIRKQIHSIAITKEQNQYFGHNVYCDGRVIGPYGSVTELIKNINHGNAKGIAIIGIKGPN